jgi:transketolase
MEKSDYGGVQSGPIDALQAGRLSKVRSGCADRPRLIATGSMLRTAVDVAQERDLSIWSAPNFEPLLADNMCWEPKKPRAWSG